MNNRTRFFDKGGSLPLSKKRVRLQLKCVRQVNLSANDFKWVILVSFK